MAQCYSGPSVVVVFVVMVVNVAPTRAQTPLPVIDGVESPALRSQCKELFEGLEKLRISLPKETDRELRAFLDSSDKDSDQTALKIQKLLNNQCLIGVSINPESRVKAGRGSKPAELIASKETVFLIRVVNEAGVTHALSLESPQVRNRREDDAQRWLEATIYPDRPANQKLSGQMLEYVLLRLKAEKPGKREATLIFDVGQGTQDLGFRAEVPILFTIKQE